MNQSNTPARFANHTPAEPVPSEPRGPTLINAMSGAERETVLAQSKAAGCSCDYDPASCRHHGVYVENGAA